MIIKKEFFSWEDCIDNILFEGGVLNFIVKSRYQTQNGGTKEIDSGDFDKNEYNTLYCYSLLYPYIYCNPYLLPYILKKNDQELIDFLNTIISNILLPDYDKDDNIEASNNFIVPSVSLKSSVMNNLYSEELLYYLDDSNNLPNMEKEIDNYEIYTNKLLEKLEFFVENIPDISLLQKKIEAHIIQDDLELPDADDLELPDADDLSSEPKSPKRKVENIQERPSTPIKQFEQEQEIKDTPDSPSGKRQRRIIITKGGKKTKNKNKKSKNKKTKKKYKSKSKIVYKKKNTKKRITRKKKPNKKVKNTKKRKNKN